MAECASRGGCAAGPLDDPSDGCRQVVKTYDCRDATVKDGEGSDEGRSGRGIRDRRVVIEKWLSRGVDRRVISEEWLLKSGDRKVTIDGWRPKSSVASHPE